MIPVPIHILSMPAAPPCAAWGPLCWADAYPGAAGYLQAIGVILALMVAIAIPTVQARVDRFRAFQAARGVASLAINHVHEVSSIVTRVPNLSTSPAEFGQNLNFRVAKAVLEEFPVHTLGDIRSIQAFIELRAVTEMADRIHTALWDWRLKHGADSESLLADLGKVAERAKKLGQVLGVK